VLQADEEKYLSNKLAYEPLEAPTTADMPPLLAKFYMDRLSRDGVEVIVVKLHYRMLYSLMLVFERLALQSSQFSNL